MDPRCEICGNRHHPRQAHRWEGGVSEAVEVPVVKVAEAVVGKPKFDRVAYQRKYMRDVYRPKKRGPKVSA